MDAGEQYIHVVLKDFKRSVSVVNIKIYNGDSFIIVGDLRVASTDGNVVEDAKAGSFRLLRMMAGRADGAKSVSGFAASHRINRGADCARRM